MALRRWIKNYNENKGERTFVQVDKVHNSPLFTIDTEINTLSLVNGTSDQNKKIISLVR